MTTQEIITNMRDYLRNAPDAEIGRREITAAIDKLSQAIATRGRPGMIRIQIDVAAVDWLRLERAVLAIMARLKATGTQCRQIDVTNDEYSVAGEFVPDGPHAQEGEAL